ncbi:MAG: glycine cleavage system protein H [Chloroflexota bacterium]|nr:glycine cleavage system protein H [Chloroflexota bacterium]
MDYVLVRNCALPHDLYYKVEEHLWVRVETDGTATLGLTDAAQTIAGAILYVNPRPTGKEYTRGATVASVESGKWIGAIRTPIAGKLIEVNPLAVKDSGLLNRSPYKRGWIARVQPTQLADDLKFLVSGAAAAATYEEFMAARNLDACIHCEGFEV